VKPYCKQKKKKNPCSKPYCSNYKKPRFTVHYSLFKTLFIIHCNRVSSSGAPAICGVSASHNDRPTTEKTYKSVHRSTPICYLRHRPAATTRLTPQETSVDLRLQQHETTSNSYPQHPSQRIHASTSFILTREQFGHPQ